MSQVDDIKTEFETIATAQVGINTFKYLMNDKRFEKIPMVLETPKGKECLEDKENLKILRKLIQ